MPLTQCLQPDVQDLLKALAGVKALRCAPNPATTLA